MVTVKELIAKYNAEEVGGRLIAVVNGKKEYIATMENGGFILTPIGLRLEQESENVVKEVEIPQPAAPAEKPKRRAKKEADADTDDLFAGIDD